MSIGDPIPYVDQKYIDEIARLRAELAAARADFERMSAHWEATRLDYDGRLNVVEAELASAKQLDVNRVLQLETALARAETAEAELAAANARYAELASVFDRINTQREKVISIAREGFEIIAGKRQCLDNLMGNADVAEDALASIEAALKGGENE